MSRFDFIEGTNSESVNNRILGLQGNGSSQTISNGRGEFPDLNDQGSDRDGVVNCDGQV